MDKIVGHMIDISFISLKTFVRLIIDFSKGSKDVMHYPLEITH